MLTSLLTSFAHIILVIIQTFSYGGIVILMALESANLPLPSELIMPFAGYLVYQGHMNIYGASLAGAVGCVIGSLLSYAIGYYGGRPFLEKYGSYLLLTKADLEVSDAFFARFGDSVAFISRLLPIVRTFISFPAGVARVNLLRFTLYTFLGSLIWSFVLAYIGEKIGKNQEILSVYFHKFDIAIVVLIVIGVALYVYRHVRSLNKRI